MDQDSLRHTKLVALYEVEANPYEYVLRYIFRWYSKAFATPLHIVDTLPLDDVLQHYFECSYEGLEPEERLAEIEKLLIDPEKLAKAKKREDTEDAEAFEYGKEASAKEALPAAPNPLADLNSKLAQLADSIRQGGGDPMPLPEKLPENVHMVFADLDAPSFGPKKTE
jgi:hypothetical protein